jgi:polysaccharide deacetylase family protein (PEP-CTERM system associated)
MHILTFDIEDWFHTHENRKYYTGHIWDQLPKRVEANTLQIINLLDELNIKATFFVLGWVAERHPDLVKRIQSKGHEMASHSHWHHNARLLSPTDFEKDLTMSLDRIQDITGEAVTAYRAPGYSLRKKDQWAFEILAAHGITVDSSIQMIGSGQDIPVVIPTAHHPILEFPLLKSVYGFPYSGGGYFRAMPNRLLKHFFSGQAYRLLYFHPRDFDANTPVSNMYSLFRNKLNTYNTQNCLNRLKQILNQTPTCTLGEAAAQFNQNQQTHG